MELSCDIEVWQGLNNRRKTRTGVDVRYALQSMKDFQKNAILFAGKNGCQENILYAIIHHDEESDGIRAISYFREACVSEEEIENLIQKYPRAEFRIFYAKQLQRMCQEQWEQESSKHIAPLTLREANAFVKANHRHHDSVTGCKFAIGLYKTVRGKEILIGVAICGRPVSRRLDDGYTLEINRICTTENGNCCSMLYGACCRIAKEMGYRKIITYILRSEAGTTLRASNFTLEDECCGGENWTGERKRRNSAVPEEKKQRWGRQL